MSFYIKGNLRGFLCEDCIENISNVTILLYRPKANSNVTAAAVADAKETFHFVTAKEQDSRKDLFVTEATTDAEGNFNMKLPEDHSGQAFDIDFSCGSVPHGPLPKRDKKVQFHITTIYPKWVQEEERSVYRWNYAIAYKWWCFIRGYFFDAWVICGRLTDCKTGTPLPNVTIKALDADLFTDDFLGSAITDFAGHFRIDYTSADFKKTFLSPVINVETDINSPFFSSGPDVYFQLEFGGNPVVFETAANRRNNVGYCLCVDLCIDKITIGDPGIPASFTHIGRSQRYQVQAEINPVSGKTLRPGADNYAFFSSIILVGSLSKKLNGKPMEYLFEFQEVATPGSPLLPGAWQPVTPGMIGKTTIGYLWYLTGDPMNPVATEDYFINGNPVTEHTATFNGNWIQVPQDVNFAPHIDTDILVLDTEKLMPVVNIDVNSMTIGNPTIPAVAPHIPNRFFALRMKQRQYGPGPLDPTQYIAGTSRAIAIFNARYNNVPKRGSWAPTKANGEYAVCSLDIQEIATGTGGCGKIVSSLHAKFNARNENLGDAWLEIYGPAKPGQTFSFPAIAVTQPEVSGTSSLVISPVDDVSDLLPCAYTVFLKVTLLLTTGDSGVGVIEDFISFCKVS